MASLADQLGKLVYSTEKGRLCLQCGEAIDECICEKLADDARLKSLDGVVRLRREIAGRKGKGVVTISGIPAPEAELKAILKKLKQMCGTGGSLKDGVIEIQGDHREKLKKQLEQMGYQVKLAGG